MKATLIAALATVFLVPFAKLTSAAPVQWSGNGHFYNVVSVPNGR